MPLWVSGWPESEVEKITKTVNDVIRTGGPFYARLRRRAPRP
jgi:hypothetical protein